MKTSSKGSQPLEPKSKKQNNKTGKIKVAVLMGGKSPEHEISLISGREVVKNLDLQKYEVLPIVISKDGKSFILGKVNYHFGQLSIVNCQLFFIAMHGHFGEDGTIQGFLELIDIPYTGSGVLASALGMDKIYSRKLFTQAGLETPRYLVFEKGNSLKKVLRQFSFPLFIKPSNQGSSIGSSKVNKRKELKQALEIALSFSRFALVEEYIKGIELTGSILGNDNPTALPLVEIVPTRQFFDYNAKYFDNQTKEIVPARLSQKLTKIAQKAALDAYRSLGCRGFGRVDMIIKGNNVCVLEVNTIPGLTPMSLLPKAAQADGISYPQLLDKIIRFAFKSS